MILFAFIITTVKFQLKILSVKFFARYDFLQWTLYLLYYIYINFMV